MVSVSVVGSSSVLVTYLQQIVGASVLNVHINGARLRALSIATVGGTPDAVQIAGKSSGFDVQLKDVYGNNADQSGLQFDVQAKSVPYFSSSSSFLNVVGQAVALNNAPGYTRNSSTLLWCNYDSTWKSIVAFGTAAIDVDLTVRLTIGYAASYLKFGRVFIATETGANSGTCYGSDPYFYYTHPLPKCTVHAGVLGIGQKADLVHMWVDGSKVSMPNLPGPSRNCVGPERLWGVDQQLSSGQAVGCWQFHCERLLYPVRRGKK